MHTNAFTTVAFCCCLALFSCKKKKGADQVETSEGPVVAEEAPSNLPDNPLIAAPEQLTDDKSTDSEYQETGDSSLTNVPVLTIVGAADINNGNKGLYSVIGECELDGKTVGLNISGLDFNTTCISGVFSVNNLDLRSVADGLVSLTAIQVNEEGTAGSSTVIVSKNTSTPTVTIDSPDNISQANVSAYTIAGTCSENGQVVTVTFSGALSFYPICSSAHWSVYNSELSSLADSTALSITADHSNSAALAAPQATTNVIKDTLSPTVTISQANEINQSNETSYQMTGTCSENGRDVHISLGSLNYTVSCSGGAWSSGFQDVSVLGDGSHILNVDHDNGSSVAASTASRVVTKSAGTPSISGLSIPSTLSTSVSLLWTLEDPGGFTIEDYEIQYKVQSSALWLPFDDGVNLNTNFNLTGLTPATMYSFRVRVHYADDNKSDWATSSGETKPDNELFDSEYMAMNVGGATDVMIAAFENDTEVTLNGEALVTLQAGETHRFTSSQFDIVDSNNPIYTAGRRGSVASPDKGNMVFSPTSWAGRYFSFNAIRTSDQKLAVYPIEDGTIEIFLGTDVIATANLSAGVGQVLTWSQYGSYRVVSTGSILAFHYSNGSGTNFVDAKPLLPSHTEIIGFPSQNLRLTVDNNGTYYNYTHSGSVTGSGTLDRDAVAMILATGANTKLYRSESLLLHASDRVSGASYADSDGDSAAVFLPTNLMKKKYIVNVSSHYVAFASKAAGTISVYNPGQVIGVDTPVQTVNIEPSSPGTGVPSKAYFTNIAGGVRFVSDVPMAGWYQPDVDIGGSLGDETVLYGAD